MTTPWNVLAGCLGIQNSTLDRITFRLDSRRSRLAAVVLISAVSFLNGRAGLAQVSTTYSYDSSNRVVQAINSTGMGVQYQYDGAGNTLGVTAIGARSLSKGTSDTIGFPTATAANLLTLNVTAGRTTELVVQSLTTSPANTPTSISVYNSAGNLVQSFTTTGGSINLDGLSTGTYSVIAVLTGAATGSAQLEYESATVPTLAQCASPQYGLYLAGSSVAQNAFSNAIATDLFGGGGNVAIYKGTNGNFQAYCGFAAAGNTAGIPASSVITIHYRGEGGMIVGALPLVSGKPIKFLDLTQSSQITALSVNVVGSSTADDANDGWTGAVTAHAVEVGVTDEEPPLLRQIDYPTQYSSTVYGTASAVQLANLATYSLFQQVFGIFVNTTGINGGGPGQALNLSAEAVNNILEGNYVNWHSVPSVTGAPVSSVSAPIAVVNQVAGSGPRIATELYFLDDCDSNPTPLIDQTPVADAYSTNDALTLANATLLSGSSPAY